MRLRSCAVGVLAALIVLVSAADASALPRKFWGIFPFDLPTTEETGLMRESGIGISRVQFDWRSIEPQPPNVFGQHDYRWAATDAWVGNLARGGIAAHALVLGSPGYLTESNAHTPLQAQGGGGYWRHYVRAVVARYGRGGEFWTANPTIPHRPIKVFQIWNEQNSSARYKPKPKPTEYADLVRIAESEIHAADPKARVVLGGMFGTPNSLDKGDGSVPAWDFLKQLYAIDGFKSRFDAVAVHPYAPDLRGVRYQLRMIRRAMKKAHDGATPIEVTELGWSSGKPGTFFFFKGRKGQAKMLDESFKLLLKKRRKWNIERLMWISWRDTERFKGCGYCEKFGLLREDLSPKPSFHDYVRYAKRGRSKR